MLRVLRHYLPLRRALLVFSETLLLFAVFGLGLSAHLFHPSDRTIALLTEQNLMLEPARMRCALSALVLALVAQLALAFNELYDFRVSSSRFDRASRFVTSSAVALFVGLGSVLVARAWDLRRVLDFPGLTPSQLVQMVVFTMLPGFVLLYLWRHIFHFTLRHWAFNERVLVLGAGNGARELVKEIGERSDSGYEVVGMLPESGGGTGFVPRRAISVEAQVPATATAAVAGAERPHALLLAPLAAPAAKTAHPATGNGNGNGDAHGKASESLYDIVQRLRVDLVVIALEDRRGLLPTDDLLRCRLEGVAVKEREAVYEHITGKIAVEALRPSYLILGDGFGRTYPGELAKRCGDVVLSLVGLVVLWPVMLAAAIAVRLDSQGPTLFRQERVGRDGQPITVLKFRSMRADAESTSGPVWAQANDPRITRIGRWLRKTRIDELPQLFNVLSGDMSLVGPRPERPVFVAELERQIPYYSQRHIVKPGLTGWAQINYPYGNTVEDARQKLQYDLFYVKNRSLLFDLSVLFTTIKTVVLRQGT